MRLQDSTLTQVKPIRKLVGPSAHCPGQALRADNISNAGARAVSFSPLGKGSALVTGSYDIRIARVRVRAVFTNTVPTQAYRSSGGPEVTFAIERLIDLAAEATGIDRVELRRRNLIDETAMPYANPFGMVYDSGRYAENMALAIQLADWSGFGARGRKRYVLSCKIINIIRLPIFKISCLKSFIIILRKIYLYV